MGQRRYYAPPVTGSHNNFCALYRGGECNCAKIEASIERREAAERAAFPLVPARVRHDEPDPAMVEASAKFAAYLERLRQPSPSEAK